jgi:hypothetical protein
MDEVGVAWSPPDFRVRGEAAAAACGSCSTFDMQYKSSSIDRLPELVEEPAVPDVPSARSRPVLV